MKTIELEKVYKPEDVEHKWYRLWSESGTFSSKVNPDRKPYCIVIPPPNVTGSLHMGHALDNTIQDILIRYHRLLGHEALWIPGVDHAGIATQRAVEKELAKQGTTRWEVGREKFLEKVWEWKEKYGGTIVNQLKRMGCSCAWDRQRFTMDEGCSKAVREAFVRWYYEGRIYRGKRIINWCPHCLTALSDLEVEHEESDGAFYHLNYPLEDGSGHITIATTRPETILADTAVAVNPDDPRYADYVGRNLILPLVGRRLPVIADSAVVLDFGTGALKVTPGHDENDWEIGNRHDLPMIVCMDEKGIMNGESGKYEGMDRFQCRKAIVEDLRESGHLEKIEPYRVPVGKCYRCHSVIEPYISEQWFVSMKELAQPAMEKVKDGTTRFIPERFGRVYLNWLENIRDWCISRQLWWGHRIPVWRCENCGYEGAFREDPDKCPKCGSEKFHQDEFVLDTWFSSGLWPFETLGWPDETPDLKYYYPTNALVTGRDIIFTWVARMMMMGLSFMGDVPFRDVNIHATILDKEGRRMSKSLGTGIDPLEIFDKFGVDATRFGIMAMTEQGQDIRFSEERVEMSRNFANKIWNASRYIFRYLPESRLDQSPSDLDFSLWDKWILTRLNTLIESVTVCYRDYRFDWACRSLYEFFWDNFCDWYIEITKPIFNGDDEKAKNRTLWILETVMDRFLRLMHPVMPFITEEIWGFLPRNRGSEEDPSRMLITAQWPSVDESLMDKDAEADFQTVIELVRVLRNMRAEAGLLPKQKAPFVVEIADERIRKTITLCADVVKNLTVAETLEIGPVSGKSFKKSLSGRAGDISAYMPLEGLVDVAREMERLGREYEKIEQMVVSLRKKCENPQFLTRANPAVVEKERQKLAEFMEQLKTLRERMEIFKD